MTAFDDQSASQPSSRAARMAGRDGSTSRLDPPDDATVISAPAAATAKPRTSAEIGQRLHGTMLGPYRLDSFIGGGGMGAVFRALDTTLDRTVAVKVLAGGQADDEEVLRRFRNEAQSAARLDHENIGRVFAVGSDDGWHYIVFEFIEGRNLRDLVREAGPFEIGRTIDVAVQVADALGHASERDVVHRDIKPSNIVITPGGKARIVDMGLARLHHLEGDRDLTVSGVTLGTFDYISPEQARDSRTADVRSDLYSLGCTMFFMLTGRPPFAEGSMVQKLLQHQQEPPPAIESLRPDVPRGFGAILGRLMEKDPADRYQRPADLVADLLAFANAHGHSLAVARPSPALAPPITRAQAAARLPWLVPLLGMVVTICGLLYQAAATRGRLMPAGAMAAADPEVVIAQPAVIRVGEAAAGATRDPLVVAAEFRAAVERANDGDIVELAFTGAVDVAPIVVRDRNLSLRAAPGMRPMLQVTSLVEAGPGLDAACHVGAGRLAVEGVSLRLAAEATSGRKPALVVLSSGSFACIDSLLVMPGDPEMPAAGAVDAAPAFISVLADGQDGDVACGITMQRSWVLGNAVFLDTAATSGGRIALSWTGGGLMTPRPVIVTDGARDAVASLMVEAMLADAVFACRTAFVSLHDSPTRPVPARFQGAAKACDFLLDGEPLIVQNGVREPADYDAACTWRDQGSRYAGTDTLRRVDGAAERIETMFRDQPAAMRHVPRVAAWPDAATWQSSWENGGG
ncbi:MAG: serine/threonine-protein kinase [Pirellulales bacterium]